MSRLFESLKQVAKDKIMEQVPENVKDKIETIQQYIPQDPYKEERVKYIKGKKTKAERAEWQRILLPESYFIEPASEEELTNITILTVKHTLKWIDGNLSAVNSALEPYFYFSNIEEMFKNINNIIQLSRYVKMKDIDSLYSIRSEYSENYNEYTHEMIERIFLNYATKIKVIETNNAKRKYCQRFLDDFSKFDNKMSNECIQFYMSCYTQLTKL